LALFVGKIDSTKLKWIPSESAFENTSNLAEVNKLPSIYGFDSGIQNDFVQLD